MAFRVPTFNLLCDVYGFATYPGGTPRFVNLPCQLRHPEHISAGVFEVDTFQHVPPMALLVPALTDIRDRFSFPTMSADTIEVPAGSGRAYRVILVDDVAKGFDNEYRLVYMEKYRPMPTPLP